MQNREESVHPRHLKCSWYAGEGGEDPFLRLAPIKREVLQPEPEPGDLILISYSLFSGEFVRVQCAFSKTVYIFHDVVGREEAKKIRKVARLEVI